MKSVLGWLGDPYIHMFAVALILARLAMGVGPDDAKAETALTLTRCSACLHFHTKGNVCRTVVVDTAARPAVD